MTADNGLYELAGGKLAYHPGDRPTGRIFAVTAVGERLFVGADSGLYQLVGDNLVHHPADRLAGPVYAVTRVGERLFLAAGNGLYELVGDNLVHHPADRLAGPVYAVIRVGARLFVRAQNDLYELTSTFLPALTTSDRELVESYAGRSARLEWPLKHSCQFAIGRDGSGLFRVRFDDDTPPIEDITKFQPGSAAGDSFIVHGDLPVRGEDGRTLTATLQFRQAGTEEWTDVPGSATEIRVNWTVLDHMLHLLKTLAPWLLGAHTLVFASLFVGARWSRWCWRVVGDPIWGKVGLWFWFALRHVPLVQRWILARWFDDTREATKLRPYHPMPVTEPASSKVFPSPEMIGHLSRQCRFWLAAGPGMGKTALVDDLTASYFTDPDRPTLEAAFRRWRFLLLPIKLRDYADAPPPKDNPANWLFDLAASEFSRHRLEFRDRALLESVLTQGDFVLLLDGANEVADDGAIQLFAQRQPDIGLLVTSQAEWRGDDKALFEALALPKAITEAIEPLLVLRLGQALGRDTFEAVRLLPVFKDIRSAYDVVLLADLVKGGTPPSDLPRSRIGLYDAMLDKAKAPDGGPFPIDELCRAAWAMMVKGRRFIAPDQDIEERLLRGLREGNAPIVRTLDGKTYEFRHDQMRAYLAAHWIARLVADPETLLEKDEDVWRLGINDQDVLWDFFAEMIGNDEGAAIWRWSLQDAERTRLQHSLQRHGKADLPEAALSPA